jgi:hypothetical protein
MSNLKQTSIISSSLYDNLLYKNIALVLGNSIATPTNSVNSNSEALVNSSLAFRLTSNNFFKVVKVPSGVDSRWKIGCSPGSYSSLPYGVYNENNWPLWSYNGFLYLILSNCATNNRIDLAGSNIPSHMLTDTSGHIAFTPDKNFAYVCVQSLPDTLSETNNNYIPIISIKPNLARGSERKKIDSYNSTETEVSNKCGPGNQSKCGSCCIYHTNFEYSPITGYTSDAGDLYGCFETQCHHCVELANKLEMDYVFHRVVVGATAGCLSCDSETSSDCGVCSCSIDLTNESYYEKILNDTNLSSSLSSWQNAKLEKINSKELSGGVACVWIDLVGYSEEARRVSDSYKDQTLYVPLKGNLAVSGREAKIEISTVKDFNNNVMIDGIKFPSDPGQGYVSAEINEEIWNAMFPSISINSLRVELIPMGGFLANLDRMFTTGMLISKIIKRSDIESSETIQTNFNQWSLQEIFDENGMNIFSGYAPLQSKVLNLSSAIAAFTPSPLSSLTYETESSTKITFDNENPFTNTTLDDRIKKFKPTSNTTGIFEISSASPERYVEGVSFTDGNDNPWTISNVTRPTTDAETSIVSTKSVVHHLEKTAIDTTVHPNISTKTWRFQIYLGPSD